MITGFFTVSCFFVGEMGEMGEIATKAAPVLGFSFPRWLKNAGEVGGISPGLHKNCAKTARKPPKRAKPPLPPGAKLDPCQPLPGRLN
jgi:hypothetical protein